MNTHKMTTIFILTILTTILCGCSPMKRVENNVVFLEDKSQYVVNPAFTYIGHTKSTLKWKDARYTRYGMTYDIRYDVFIKTREKSRDVSEIFLASRSETPEGTFWINAGFLQDDYYVWNPNSQVDEFKEIFDLLQSQGFTLSSEYRIRRFMHYRLGRIATAFVCGISETAIPDGQNAGEYVQAMSDSYVTKAVAR